MCRQKPVWQLILTLTLILWIVTIVVVALVDARQEAETRRFVGARLLRVFGAASLAEGQQHPTHIHARN
jgi:hypothetical protein